MTVKTRQGHGFYLTVLQVVYADSIILTRTVCKEHKTKIFHNL